MPRLFSSAAGSLLRLGLASANVLRADTMKWHPEGLAIDVIIPV
jgi:hypothetical protein